MKDSSYSYRIEFKGLWLKLKVSRIPLAGLLENLMQRLAFLLSLPCAVWGQCMGGAVFFATYFDEQLEDREGAVGLNGDKGDFQKWTISDAGSGRVLLTSHFGAHLEDRDGSVGLSADTGEFQWWALQCADDGRIFLTSHRGVQLEDREGTLSLNGDRGEWQMWRVLQDGALTQCTCDDFPSPPPTPPAPPGPTPGPLPPIPQQLWFGFWGNNAGDSSYDISSLVFDNPSDEDIEQHGGTSLRFLYPAFKFFCQEQAETGSCTLFSDFQSRWAAAVPRMQQLLADQKIIGFTIGDERICGEKFKTPVEDWIAMIDTIRASFPDRSQAVIHTNECGSTFGEPSSVASPVSSSGDRRRRSSSSCGDAAVSSVPEGLDWVSFDKYRSDDRDDFFSKYIKARYENCVFPKLHSGQKIGLTPQISYDGHHFCDDQCIADVELKDAKDCVTWARSESRIAFITAYAYRDLSKIGSKADKLMSYWSDFGRSTRPGAAVLQI